MKILVISPHADDETLGCGGTILRHIDRGDEVTVAQMSQPGKDLYEKKYMQAMKEQVKQVINAYKLQDWIVYDYTYGSLHEGLMPRLVADLMKLYKEKEPEVLYIPYIHDMQTDHQTVARAAIAAAKPHRHPYLKRILMYETLSETEASPLSQFQPNYFVDIFPFSLAKRTIFDLYVTEVLNFPSIRNEEGVNTLAYYRGQSVSLEKAEAFMILRWIE